MSDIGAILHTAGRFGSGYMGAAYPQNAQMQNSIKAGGAVGGLLMNYRNRNRGQGPAQGPLPVGSAPPAQSDAQTADDIAQMQSIPSSSPDQGPTPGSGIAPTPVPQLPNATQTLDDGAANLMPPQTPIPNQFHEQFGVPPRNTRPQQAAAQGTVVSKPTNVLLGEDGPEAVIPLNGRPDARVSTANLPQMQYRRR
jgi:hypothetical protein